MNDRIRELAEQHGVDITIDGMGYGEGNIQGFVELIIRECMDICITENVSNLDLNVMHNSSKFEIQNMATKSCGENLAKRIKEHFGVEDIEEDSACPLCGEDGGTTCGMEGCQY